MADMSAENMTTGRVGGSIKVDTAELAKHMGDISAALTELKDYLNSVSLTAPSLGESTFRPTIEQQLLNIKNSYLTGMEPIIQKMITDMEAVRSQYEARANAIGGATGVTGAGAPTNNNANINQNAHW